MTSGLYLLIIAASMAILFYIGVTAAVKVEVFETFREYTHIRFYRILLRLAALVWPVGMPLLFVVKCINVFLRY